MRQMIDKVGVKEQDKIEGGVFVRMHLNNLHIFILWLSNGNLQCRFNDRSQLIVGSEYSMYINANKIKIIFESKLLNDQNDQIIQKQAKLAKILKKIKSGEESHQYKENIVPN